MCVSVLVVGIVGSYGLVLRFGGVDSDVVDVLSRSSVPQERITPLIVFVPFWGKGALLEMVSCW